MECADACRNFTATATPQPCSSGQMSIQCRIKSEGRTAYTCGKPGAGSVQTCHVPQRAAVGKNTNVKH